MFVFGPVPSRRLGRSLGVDLVPFKTCSYDCIYCQLGLTTHKTVERREWVPLDEVLVELEGALEREPDIITLSGSGEPTLYARTGELIERVKEMTEIPVAVLTNGSLLWQDEVRADLMKADLVIPSLDVGTQSELEAVNRPHPEVTFPRMLEGLMDFAKDFAGRCRMEVLLLEGLTSSDESVERIADHLRRIGPDEVQLNTVARPPAESFARAITRERLGRLAELFDPPVEVIGDFKRGPIQGRLGVDVEEVKTMLRRRPCSVDDVAGGLGIHRTEALKVVELLEDRGEVEAVETPRGRFYRSVS